MIKVCISHIVNYSINVGTHLTLSNISGTYKYVYNE